jgi:chitodextrinase
MKRRILFIALMVFAGSIIFAQQIESTGPQPEYMPYCSSPQQIAPEQAGCTEAGWGFLDLTADPVAWNGKEFASVFCYDLSENFKTLFFRRFFADGTPAGQTITVAAGIYATGGTSGRLGIAWDGSGYGVVWDDNPGVPGYSRAVYFAKLDAQGNTLVGPIRLSYYGGTQDYDSYDPQIAAGASGFCAVWTDDRNGNYDIYATTIDGSGAVVSHDIQVCASLAAQEYPCATWHSSEAGYRVVWHDNRNYGISNGWDIYGAKVFTWGGAGDEKSYVVGISNSTYPFIAASGAGLGMTFQDDRADGYQVYFLKIGTDGAPLGSPVRVSIGTTTSNGARIVGTGAEYGIFFSKASAAMGSEIWYQRVSGSGSIEGDNVQLSTVGGAYAPVPAFAKYGYLLSYRTAYSFAPFIVEPVGCNSPYAPGCPTNLIAYGVSGTTATIAWQAALDNYTDIAYYSVYRNDSSIAKTSNTYYTDTGLGLNTTYNYTVRAVNAAQMTNDQISCGSQSQSVYVKTNASFTLLLDKSSDPSAHLYWNDGGMNNYNIFRGTSPQVMSLIGSTSGQSADDVNVLLDKNNYFYTVDDPGE